MDNSLAIIPSVEMPRPSLARSVQNWNATDQVPEGVTAAETDAAKRGAQARLILANPLAAGRFLKPLLDFSVAFGIKLPDRDGLISIYLEAVRLPADLWREAVDRAVRSWKWGNRLPMPAELMGMVEAEMMERHNDLFQLTALAGKFYREPKSGKFLVSSLGAKNSVLRDLGQDEYDRRILEIRAALARGLGVALWTGNRA